MVKSTETAIILALIATCLGTGSTLAQSNTTLCAAPLVEAAEQRAPDFIPFEDGSAPIAALERQYGCRLRASTTPAELATVIAAPSALTPQPSQVWAEVDPSDRSPGKAGPTPFPLTGGESPNEASAPVVSADAARGPIAAAVDDIPLPVPRPDETETAATAAFGLRLLGGVVGGAMISEPQEATPSRDLWQQILRRGQPVQIGDTVYTAALNDRVIATFTGLFDYARALVRVESEPPGGRVWVGPNLLGGTELAGWLKSSLLPTLRIESEGYHPCGFDQMSRSTHFTSDGELLRLSCELIKVR